MNGFWLEVPLKCCRKVRALRINLIHELLLAGNDQSQQPSLLLDRLVLQQLEHRRPLVLVLLQALRHDVNQVLVHRGWQGVVVGFEDLVKKAYLGLSIKGVLVGAQLVQDAAEGPDVGLGAVGLLLADLRGEIVWGADHRHGKLGSVLLLLGDPQVPNLDGVGLAHEEVDGLDVPVQDLAGMQVLQA